MVRSLTGAERDQYEEALIRWRSGEHGRVAVDASLTNARAKLVSLAVVDGDGKRLFTDQDVVALGQRNAKALARIFDVAARLSGLTAGDVAELAASFG